MVHSSRMLKEETALLLCGSFNPVTNLHLRMLEIARDHLVDLGFDVKRAFISPVHDKYGKAGLVSITHRINMIKHALKSSDWIQLSSWESEQSDWTKTYKVLHYHQERLNCLLNNTNIKKTNGSRDMNGNPVDYKVTVMLVCGGDMLNSFSVPGLWDPADIQGILTNHGIAVITRSGYDIDKIVYETDALFCLRKNIRVVTEYIENTVSSTKVRKACMRGQSIKYLVPDEVERYIKTHKLYSSSTYKYKTGTNEKFRISAELFNDYKNFPSNNKLSAVNAPKKQKNRKQRKKIIKEETSKKRPKRRVIKK